VRGRRSKCSYSEASRCFSPGLQDIIPTPSGQVTAMSPQYGFPSGPLYTFPALSYYYTWKFILRITSSSPPQYRFSWPALQCAACLCSQLQTSWTTGRLKIKILRSSGAPGPASMHWPRPRLQAPAPPPDPAAPASSNAIRQNQVSLHTFPFWPFSLDFPGSNRQIVTKEPQTVLNVQKRICLWRGEPAAPARCQESAPPGPRFPCQDAMSGF
jgi:hypothetical protein